MTRFFSLLIGVLAFAAPANAALLVNYDFTTNAKASFVAGGLNASDFNQTGITAGVVNTFGTNGSGVYGGNPAPSSTLPTNAATGALYANYRVNTTTGRFEAQLNNSMSNSNNLGVTGSTFALVRITNPTPYRFDLSSFGYTLFNVSPTSPTTNGGGPNFGTNTAAPTILEQTQFRVVSPSTQNTAAYSVVTTGVSVTAGNNTVVQNRALNVSLLAGESIELRVALRRNTSTGVRIFAIDNFRIDGDVVPEPASVAVFGGLAAFGLFRRARRK